MSNVSYQVRPATSADRSALVLLRRSMYEAMGVPAHELDNPAWQGAFQGWLEHHLDDPDTLIVVAVTPTLDGSDPIGPPDTVAACAIGEVTHLIPGPEFESGRVGLLSNVSVLAPFRGLGLGSACTDAVLDWFTTTARVDRIDLFATDTGEPIYLRRGFERRRFPAMVRRVSPTR